MDDDEFLRQLEAKLSGSGSRLRKSRVLEEFAMGADEGWREIEADIDPGSQTDDSAVEREWLRARRAMMCVREIVRTEKSYLKHLSGFANGEVSVTALGMWSLVFIFWGFARTHLSRLLWLTIYLA